jgi:hypothetical protein
MKYPDPRIEAYNIFNIPIPGAVVGTIHYTSGSSLTTGLMKYKNLQQDNGSH